MQLLFMMSVVLAIAITEGAPEEPIAGSSWRLAATLGAIGLVAMLAIVLAQVTAWRIRTESSRTHCLRWFDRMRAVHTIVWLTATGGILYGLGWTQLVRWNWRLDGLFLADDLLVLAPVVLPMVLSWAAFFEVDRAVALVSPNNDLPPISRWRYVTLHIRHYFGLLLLPVLLVFAVDDAWRLFDHDLFLIDGSPSNKSAIVLLPLVALMALGLPLLVRLVWPMRPLAEGDSRQRQLERHLLSSARRWRTPFHKILVWKTGGRMINAAVAGFVSRLRYLILTDALVENLTDEEILAVCAHEAGHVHNRHLLLRGVLVILPLGIWSALLALFPAAQQQGIAALSSVGVGPSAQAALVVPIAIGLYAWFVFGPYCRLLEFEADLFACSVDTQASLAEEARNPGETFAILQKPFSSQPPSSESVVRFQGTLRKLAALGGPRGRTWLHPAIDARIDFLREVVENPVVFRRLRRQTRWLAAGLVLATLVCWTIVFVAA